MARTALRAGRRVVIANSRGPESLASVVSDLGDGVSAGTVERASAAGIVVIAVPWDRATGESYTIAHHVLSEDGKRKIMVASLRYLDTFAKIDQRWYFAERDLILDWSETRALGTDKES